MSQGYLNPVNSDNFALPHQLKFTGASKSRPELDHRQLKVANRQSLELNFKNKARQAKVQTRPAARQITTEGTISLSSTSLPWAEITTQPPQSDSGLIYQTLNTVSSSTSELLGTSCPVGDFDYTQLLLDPTYENNISNEEFFYNVNIMCDPDNTTQYIPSATTNPRHTTRTPQQVDKQGITQPPYTGSPEASPRSNHSSFLPSPSPSHSPATKRGTAADVIAKPNTTPVGTPPIPSAAQTTYIPTKKSVGKQIRMCEEHVGEAEVDEDEDEDEDDDNEYDSRSEVGDESDDETFDNADQFISLIDSTVVDKVDEAGLLQKLETLSKSVVLEDNFLLTKKRVVFFSNLSQYIDSKCKKVYLKNNFKDLFTLGIPNMASHWDKMSLKTDCLTGAPNWIRWLLVYTSLCFGVGVSRLTVQNELKKTVAKMSDANSTLRDMLSCIRAFVKSATKSRRSSSKRGDIIHGDGTPSASPRTSVATPSPARDERNFDGPFRNPPTPKKRGPKQIPNRPSLVSSDTPTANPPLQTASKKRSFCGIQSSDESDAGSRSDSSSTRGRRRRTQPDYRPYFPTTDNAPRDGRRVTFNEPQEYSHVRLTSPTLELSIFTKEDVQIKIRKEDLSTDWKYKNQKLMTNLKPNVYVCEAMRDVLIVLIEKGNECPASVVKFSDIANNFMKSVTLSVMGKSSSDVNEYTEFLKNSKDIKKKDAISLCITLYLFYCSKDAEKVSVSWAALVKWVGHMATILREQVTRINLMSDNQTRDFKIEFMDMRKGLEENLNEKHGDLLSLFDQLSKINDMILYMLFGVNIYKGDRTYYTDLMAKTVMLILKTKGHIPMGNRECNLNNIFWSLPIAYLVQLQGFGRKVEEEQMETHCSFEDFMLEGLAMCNNN